LHWCGIHYEKQLHRNKSYFGYSFVPNGSKVDLKKAQAIKGNKIC